MFLEMYTSLKNDEYYIIDIKLYIDFYFFHLQNNLSVN